MPKVSSNNFREILKNDGYAYTLTSKTTEPIDVNFPNMPDWHREEFEEWRHEILPDADVIWFEYNGVSYKILRNMGDADCNDGNFGAVFDGNNDKVMDVISSGDMETTLHSLKTDEPKISDELQAKLAPNLRYFEVVLHGNTEFEYVVFKVFVENGCLYDISDIDDRYEYDSDELEEEEQAGGDEEAEK